MDLTRLSPADALRLFPAIDRLHAWAYALSQTISAQFPGVSLPGALFDLAEATRAVGNQLDRIGAGEDVARDLGSSAGLLKRAVLHYRRARVAEIEAMRSQTNNPHMKEGLTAEQDLLDPLFSIVDPENWTTR
jgi:hypothetical protein